MKPWPARVTCYQLELMCQDPRTTHPKRPPVTPFLFLSPTMGKLNIAHHKSYHPYRLDNIERVRRDEAAAKLKETEDADRALVAVRLGLHPNALLTTPCRMLSLVWMCYVRARVLPLHLLRRLVRKMSTVLRRLSHRGLGLLLSPCPTVTSTSSPTSRITPRRSQRAPQSPSLR